MKANKVKSEYVLELLEYLPIDCLSCQVCINTRRELIKILQKELSKKYSGINKIPLGK